MVAEYIVQKFFFSSSKDQSFDVPLQKHPANWFWGMMKEMKFYNSVRAFARQHATQTAFRTTRENVQLNPLSE